MVANGVKVAVKGTDLSQGDEDREVFVKHYERVFNDIKHDRVPIFCLLVVKRIVPFSIGCQAKVSEERVV